MSTETKFLFETDFGNPNASQSRTCKYCEKDIVAATQEALELAREELRNLEEKRAADLLADISVKLDALSARRAEDLQSATENAAAIAVAMCRKVLPTLAAQNALTEIDGHIARTLADVRGEPRVVVRVSEENIAALQPRIDSLANGFDGKIVLLADEQLSATDCHVMWADGGSERDVQRTWSAIEQAVEQITNDGAGFMTSDPATGTGHDITADTSELSHNSNSLENSSQATD